MKRTPFIDISEMKVEFEKEITKKRKTFTAKELKEFEEAPYELPEREQLMLDLFYKRRQPQNAQERTLLSQIKKIISEGKELNLKGEVF